MLNSDIENVYFFVVNPLSLRCSTGDRHSAGGYNGSKGTNRVKCFNWKCGLRNPLRKGEEMRFRLKETVNLSAVIGFVLTAAVFFGTAQKSEASEPVPGSGQRGE